MAGEPVMWSYPLCFSVEQRHCKGAEPWPTHVKMDRMKGQGCGSWSTATLQSQTLTTTPPGGAWAQQTVSRHWHLTKMAARYGRGQVHLTVRARHQQTLLMTRHRRATTWPTRNTNARSGRMVISCPVSVSVILVVDVCMLFLILHCSCTALTNHSLSPLSSFSSLSPLSSLPSLLFLLSPLSPLPPYSPLLSPHFSLFSPLFPLSSPLSFLLSLLSLLTFLSPLPPYSLLSLLCLLSLPSLSISPPPLSLSLQICLYTILPVQSR